MKPNSLKLATRGSPLAMAQSGHVAKALEQKFPGLSVELVPIKSQGDIILDRPLREVGGKGLFTTAVEEVLLAGEADLAVHSLKDMDSIAPVGLKIVAYPKREDPRDVLVTMDGISPARLPNNACIGTGGLRRVAQLRTISTNYSLAPLRGNINTRLEKLAAGEFDAIMLAAAGLIRGDHSGRIGAGAFDPGTILPAPGQGILAVQMPNDHPMAESIRLAIDHFETRFAAVAERAFLASLGGNCHSPVAAFMQWTETQVTASMSVFLAPTRLGENQPLVADDLDLVNHVWRSSLDVEIDQNAPPNQQLDQAAHIGRALADRAREGAPKILADWQARG